MESRVRVLKGFLVLTEPRPGVARTRRISLGVHAVTTNWQWFGFQAIRGAGVYNLARAGQSASWGIRTQFRTITECLLRGPCGLREARAVHEVQPTIP